MVTPLFNSWNKRLCVLQLMSLQPLHPLLLCLSDGLQKELNLLGNNRRTGLCWLGQCDTVSIRLCKLWTICSSCLCVNQIYLRKHECPISISVIQREERPFEALHPPNSSSSCCTEILLKLLDGSSSHSILLNFVFLSCHSDSHIYV